MVTPSQVTPRPRVARGTPTWCRTVPTSAAAPRRRRAGAVPPLLRRAQPWQGVDSPARVRSRLGPRLVFCASRAAGPRGAATPARRPARRRGPLAVHAPATRRSRRGAHALSARAAPGPLATSTRVRAAEGPRVDGRRRAGGGLRPARGARAHHRRRKRPARPPDRPPSWPARSASCSTSRQRATIGAAARAHIERHFTWEQSIEARLDAAYGGRIPAWPTP